MSSSAVRTSYVRFKEGDENISQGQSSRESRNDIESQQEQKALSISNGGILHTQTSSQPYKSIVNEDEFREPSKCKRRLVFVLGLTVAWLTILPNAMMSASNAMAGAIGLLASLLFAIGGVYGYWAGEFKWLLPGLAVQFVSLLAVSFSAWW